MVGGQALQPRSGGQTQVSMGSKALRMSFWRDEGRDSPTARKAGLLPCCARLVSVIKRDEPSRSYLATNSRGTLGPMLNTMFIKSTTRFPLESTAQHEDEIGRFG